MILADIPDKPTSAPTRNVETDESTVGVNIVVVPDDHGSAITSYNIEIDDGQGGPFVELQGDTYDSMALVGKKISGVLSGVMYRFRYRARNEIGFGEYSEIAYILTASKPEEPALITATIIGSDVLISWQMPYNAASLISIAEIKILTSDGI